MFLKYHLTIQIKWYLDEHHHHESHFVFFVEGFSTDIFGKDYDFSLVKGVGSVCRLVC